MGAEALRRAWVALLSAWDISVGYQGGWNAIFAFWRPPPNLLQQGSRFSMLELDIDTASRGVFDGPFGLVVEVIVLQAVAGRSQGGEMGAGARATHPSDRRTWPRSTRRTMEGGIAWMWRNGEGSVCVCVCICKRVWKGFCGRMKECVFGKGTCSLSGTEGKAKVFAFVSMGADTKANTLGRWLTPRW